MTNKFMANFHQIFLFLFLFFIQQSLTQNPPIVPLTNALTAIYCHNFNEIGIMTIRCGINEKIRMLDAFDVVVKNKSHLPLECLKNQEHYSFMNHDNNHSSSIDCKIPTSFTSACSGRESCTLHMQRKHLTTPKENCYNELVDYTIAFFECISDVFIHDVCSSQAITSAWGTLKTPNFPNPYTANDDCWCKLSTQVQQHLLLSVIVFQLIPYDQQCAGAGLYLQSSEKQRSTQCTYLQQGYNYLSDTNSLYMNFYSRTSTVRGGFWIIYEASHPNAEVHLHCGSREKIGVPSTIQSDSLPLIPSSYNHGWSRLVYDKLLNPATTLVNEQMMRMRLLMTTPRSFLDRNFKISTSTIAAGAFTYPYGRLTTFELDYGPRGWFLKYLFGSNMTATKFLQTTTTQLPAVKWSSTWRYIRRFRPRIFTTTTTTIKTTTKMATTTTISTTIPTTTISTTIATTTISTTIPTTTTTAIISTTIPTTTTTISTTIPTTTTSTSTAIVTSTIRTIEQTTIPIFSTTTPTVILETVSAEQSLLVISEPWIPYSTPNIESSITPKTTTIIPRIKSMTNLPSLSLTSKTTLQPPTPWYSPAGPFDWWYWQRYITKVQKLSIDTHTATTTQKTTTATTTVVTTVSTTTEKSTSTIIKTTTSTTTTSTTTKRPMILTIEPTTTTTTTLPRKNQTTIDWFKWPHHEFTTTLKGRAHYDEEEYNDWADYFTSTEIQSSTIIDPLLYIRPDKPRQKFQQMSYLPTKPNEQINNPSTTNLTLSTKSYINRIIEGVTITNPQNIIQPIIKKSLEENGWFGKTDMKIVFVSILFVILLFLINLILFAVRRHRRQIQGRHLLSASSLNAQRILSNNHIQNSRHGLPINNLISTTNNNDILPAVGEIVIWDEKDQGGYMIDNQGEWAKVGGHQWFRNNILKTCNKTSFTKSFRSRFQFIRQSKKKCNYRPPQTPKIPQHGFKSPLLIDTPSLSPVPEIDDYRLSQISSEKINSNFPNKIQTLIHQDQDQSDEYYKRIEIAEDESIYSTMNRTDQEDYSLNNQNFKNNINQQGSVIISVPTMLRQEDETTYDEDSISNQNYPIQNSKMNNTIIIGYCQTDFQPLDPKLLLKSSEKSLLADHQQFYSYSQSLQLSPYDSGFFDDQTIDSSTTTSSVDLEKSIHERRHSQDEKY